MKRSTTLIAAACTAVAIFLGSNVNAQTKTPPSSPWRFGIGLEAGIPTGDIHTASSFELGGTARLQYDASNHFAYTLTSGYYNFFGKDIDVAGTTVKAPSFGVVPLKAGIKAFFSDNLYFGAEAGAGFETNSGGSTKLILSPTLGFANSTWDVGVRYENFSGQGVNYGLAGLRVAYAFPL